MSEIFEREPSEVVRARRMVGAALRSWGLGGELPPFELAVSELVSNALVHGGGQVEVRLRDDGDGVRLDVVDRGGGTPEVRRQGSGAEAPGGWGLQFVDQLADEWGTETGPDRTLVWMVRRHGATPG
ncbi:MAG TPA: ATP-binding protein [Acidimicrobiales bacterium]